MNPYEIEQIEKEIRATTRLPLTFGDWADMERQAREERARVMGNAISGFFATVAANVTGLVRKVRSTTADCADARLRHN